MISIGEDELICDFAETYHVINWRELPPSLAAVLACGLPDGSRIKRKLAGCKLTLEQTLTALMLDNLRFILWTKTKDALKGRNKPESIYKKLAGLEKKPREELETFDSPEAFDEWHRSKMRN